MYKYFFHIIDREFNDAYDFQGYFYDHDEVGLFIADNEKVGNIVYIVSPYYEFVQIDDCPPCYANT